MSDETTNGPDLAAELAALRAEMKGLREKTEARLSDIGKQQAAIKHALRGTSPPPPSSNGGEDPAHPPVDPPRAPAAPVPGALTYADLRATIEIERTRASVPEKMRAIVDRLRETGAPLDEVLAHARALVPGAPPPAPSESPPAPRTAERPAAPPTARAVVRHPRTLGEYYALAGSNPEAKKQLDRDPTFHPEDLPLRE